MLGFSFVISLVLWTWFSWPLPRYVASGIPAAARLEPAEIQFMLPGDHLQYLYYCRLAQDMFAGKTPLFYNLYEFHTGTDRACFQPDTYYFPFSFLYALSAWIGGMAFGWNLTGFISLWGTCLLTWLLARRYTSSDGIAAAASAVAIALPFLWINLCGGSPAGFAMLWIPALWLGLDLAVRENSVRGGLLAGFAILFARWTDQHVFFFGALAMPAWCLLAWIGRTDHAWKQKATWQGIIWALLPTAILAALALLLPLGFQWLARLVTGLPPAAAAVSQRTLQEITNYSPTWQGLFFWRNLGMSNVIYFGYVATAILAGGGMLAGIRSVREWKTRWRSLLILALIGVGMLGIIALALGTRGPEQGALFRLCRDLIPPYGMVRQPAKIFCLMPSVLAVALAFTLAALMERLENKPWRLLVPALAGLLIVMEYGLRIHPTISLLDQRQEAYAAVADDIRAEASKASILVLPLWPGDSHYSSLYQHYALRYRIRMVNGYSPIVAQEYFDRVFRGLESANMGRLTADQFRQLQEMNVRYILLHEDQFPEKVSPFPVTFTLKQLLSNPRLRLLKQDGPVWAFKILPAPEHEGNAAVPDWDVIGCARRWEAEAPASCFGAGGVIVNDAVAGGAGFVSLRTPNAWLGTRATKAGRAPGLRWLIRARGNGTLVLTLLTNDQTALVCFQDVRTPEWYWVNIPIQLPEGFGAVALKLALQRGTVDIDTVLLAAGRWESPAPGQSLSIPAPCFFHAGYIDRERDSVILRKDHDPNALDFYGMKLPLEKGMYKVEFVFRSDAARGTPLGQLNIRRRHSDPVTWTAVTAGRPAAGVFIQNDNLPLHLEFLFLRNADIEIIRVVFTRLE